MEERKAYLVDPNGGMGAVRCVERQGGAFYAWWGSVDRLTWQI
jgi:hypothetical protein